MTYTSSLSQRVLILLYLISFATADFLRGDTAFGADFSVVNPGRLYSYEILMVRENVNWYECAFTCIRHLQCVTFNFNAALRMCELVDLEFDEYEVDTDSKGWVNFGTPKAVHGGFTKWTQADLCSVKCGGGILHRFRTCTNPSPKYGGKQCDGEEHRTLRCNTQPCLKGPYFCNITVLSVDHKASPFGKYFFFNGILNGLFDKRSISFLAVNTRSGQKGTIVVFHKSAAYPYFDGYGRFGTNLRDGQFEVGDKITILDQQYCPSAKCKWILQKYKLCFGSRQNSFGSFVTSHDGKLSGVRFEYISGKVYCSHKLWSYWGCPYLSAAKLGVIVTDKDKNAIFPPSYAIDKIRNYYEIPGFLANSSTLELFFPEAGPQISKGTELNVWYIEDWRDIHEHDNLDSKTCAKVFAKYNCD